MAPPPFTFAFQPIVDVTDHSIYGYEALIRGTRNESAGEILGSVTGADLYALDEQARAVAVTLASRLGLSRHLSINFMPNSLARSEQTLDNTIRAAERCSFPLDRLILEVTEGEMIQDTQRWAAAIDRCRSQGVRLAIDDFGAGYSGLNLLAQFQPDLLKIDMNLVRSIHSNGPRQAIVRGILQTCADLGIDVIAEGVETAPEYFWFKRHNVELYQGYLFAKPGFETLPGARLVAEQPHGEGPVPAPVIEIGPLSTHATVNTTAAISSRVA